MSSPALALSGLVAGYGRLPVAGPATLDVPMGVRAAVIGPNGSGKSTLLKAVIGESAIIEGSLSVLGQSMNRIQTDRMVRSGVRYLRQAQNVFPGLSVQDNLDLALYGAGPLKPRSLESLLDLFPRLRGLLGQRAGLLSGGQRQMLAIAMVLAGHCKLLLLDEPLAGVAQGLGTELMESIDLAYRSEGFAMILVEHKLEEIAPFVDRVIVISRGMVLDDNLDVSVLVDPKRLEPLYLS